MPFRSAGFAVTLHHVPFAGKQKDAVTAISACWTFQVLLQSVHTHREYLQPLRWQVVYSFIISTCTEALHAH